MGTPIAESILSRLYEAIEPDSSATGSFPTDKYHLLGRRRLTRLKANPWLLISHSLPTKDFRSARAIVVPFSIISMAPQPRGSIVHWVPSASRTDDMRWRGSRRTCAIGWPFCSRIH